MIDNENKHRITYCHILPWVSQIFWEDKMEEWKTRNSFPELNRNILPYYELSFPRQQRGQDKLAEGDPQNCQMHSQHSWQENDFFHCHQLTPVEPCSDAFSSECVARRNNFQQWQHLFELDLIRKITRRKHVAKCSSKIKKNVPL